MDLRRHLFRRPDNARVDERAAGRRDHRGNLLDRRRIDGVAIDIDRLGIVRGEDRRETLRQRERVARRQDRQNKVGRGDFLVACRHHAGLARPRRGGFTPARKACQDAHAVAGEPLSMPAPMVPGAMMATAGVMVRP